MDDGIYMAMFEVGPNHGRGVAVKNGSRILGGDGSHYWSGAIKEEDGELRGELLVKPHSGGAESVFGFFDEFPLRLSGPSAPKGGAYQFDGSTPVAPGRLMRQSLRMLEAA